MFTSSSSFSKSALVTQMQKLFPTFNEMKTSTIYLIITILMIIIITTTIMIMIAHLITHAAWCLSGENFCWVSTTCLSLRNYHHNDDDDEDDEDDDEDCCWVDSAGMQLSKDTLTEMSNAWTICFMWNRYS